MGYATERKVFKPSLLTISGGNLKKRSIYRAVVLGMFVVVLLLSFVVDMKSLPVLLAVMGVLTAVFVPPKTIILLFIIPASIFASYQTVFSIASVDIRIFDFLLLTAVMSYCIQLVRTKSKPKLGGSVGFTLAIFLILAAATSSISWITQVDHVALQSVFSFLRFLSYAVLFYVVVNTFERKDVRTLLFLFVIAAFIQVLFSIVQWVSQFVPLWDIPVLSLKRNRVTGLLRVVATLGAYFSFALAVTIGLWKTEPKKRTKHMLYATAVLIILGLLLSGSRAGILVGAFILLSYVVFFEDHKHRIKFLLLCLVIGVLVMPGLGSRVIGSLSLSDYNNGIRAQHWNLALEHMKLSPVFGSGWYDYPLREKAVNAHNAYLQVGADTGIVGLLAFLVFVITFLGFTFRGIIRSSADSVLVGCLFFSFVGIFLVFLTTHNLMTSSFPILFFLMIGSVCVLHKTRKPRTKVHLMHIITTVSQGGAEKHLLALLSHIDKSKYDISVVYFEGDGALKKDFEHAGVSVYHVPLRRNPLKIFIKLSSLIHALSVDIVHTHLFLGDFYGIIAAKLAGVKTILSTKHNTDLRYKAIVVRALERFTSRCVTMIVVISDNVKQYFEQVVKVSRPIQRIHYAIRIPENKPKKGRTVTIGAVGRLIPRKAHVDLVNASAKLPDNVQVVIVGDGPLKETLKQHITVRNLQHKVTLAGFRRDIAQVMSTFDIFVHTPYAEGFGLVVLEAMALGKPVIASRAGALPEIVVDKTGIIVQPRDVDALAGAMHMLASNKKLRERMGREGKKRVKEQFGVQKMITAYENLYDSLHQEAQ